VKAVFLDRDGSINKPVLYRELGLIGSPIREEQMELLPGAAAGIRLLNSLGLKVIVVSNQPGVAKGNMTEAMLEAINKRMRVLLEAEGAFLDAVYYCPHHPSDGQPPYRQECRCRKPNPGLLEQSARAHGLELAASYMVGDSYTDMLTGQAAGCRSILLGGVKCDSCRLMQEVGAMPEAIAASLWEAAVIIQSWETDGEDIR
jgi:D-glycero-D-manno-heptose 1,7-bisphosphate phosphatase